MTTTTPRRSRAAQTVRAAAVPAIIGAVLALAAAFWFSSPGTGAQPSRPAHSTGAGAVP